jgi:hypothetical protein
MAEEVKNFIFEPKEIVEMLIKKQGLHEGIWGLLLHFSFGGANTGPSEDEIYPTAVAAVTKIGLQPFAKENNIALDAAKINPPEAK